MRIRAGIILLLSLFCYSLMAQDFNEKVYNLYIHGDMDSWEKLLNAGNWKVMERSDQYDFAMAHYGFIGYCIGSGQKARAKPYLEVVEQISEDLLIRIPDDPTYLSLRAGLYGFRIGYQPQKAMFIGPKALKILNNAFQKAPDCPQAWIESGNKNWSTPEIFGGSKIKAIADYEKAIKMMERDPLFISRSWYYLNANTILASWYQSRNRTFAAREIYRKLIKIEPGFTWALEKLNKFN